MIPLGWLPAGLKYRSSAPFHSSPPLPAFFATYRSALTKSVIMFSTANFVLPYGFVGPNGHSSGIGIMFSNLVASPYTVAELEKTMFVTLCFFMLRSKHNVPYTFTL